LGKKEKKREKCAAFLVHSLLFVVHRDGCENGELRLVGLGGLSKMGKKNATVFNRGRT